MNAPGGARRVSSVQENPTGAADLSEIRRSRIGQTLGRRPETILFTGGRRGQKRARGMSATSVAAAVRDGALRRGTPQGFGRDGGHLLFEDDGLRAVRRRGVSLPLNLRARGAETPRQWIASGAAMRCGPEFEAALERRENPMDGSGPRGREVSGEEPVEEVRNLEDGTCRGRHPPGGADPLAQVVGGARNPRRGVPGRETGSGTRGGEP
jgi:hypothetical protein